tara:strand:- start:152 stop:403 length:252 start_codon:yes stop_codon:yes gene_type:complete
MTQQEKSNKLRAEAPTEIPKFVKAAKILNEMTGLSASVTVDQRDSIREILSFTPATTEGKELRDNMLKKADSHIPEDGLFLID